MKAKSRKASHSYIKRLWPLWALTMLVIAASLAYWLWPSNKNQGVPQPASGTTSKVTPHQEAPVSNTNQQGGVIDQQGKTSGTLPPSSAWTTSSSGNITLQQPTASQTLHSGDTISGTAKVSTVQFLLKDNAVGVIAQGTMSVVNGRFSGTLGFSPHSSNGTLEVYYPNPSTGAEQDIINIDVNFSTQ